MSYETFEFIWLTITKLALPVALLGIAIYAWSHRRRRYTAAEMMEIDKLHAESSRIIAETTRGLGDSKWLHGDSKDSLQRQKDVL